jgi:hypothetical protein
MGNLGHQVCWNFSVNVELKKTTHYVFESSPLERTKLTMVIASIFRKVCIRPCFAYHRSIRYANKAAFGWAHLSGRLRL